MRLGQTDLEVTRYCQGTAFRHLERHAADPEAEKVLRHCLDVGVNFFDSAHAYGWGGAEELLGKVLVGRRSQAVVCTKVPASCPPEREGVPGASVQFTEEYLMVQLEAALKRLRTDYVDVYLLHQPDGRTSEEKICQSMDRLVRSGKVRVWGLSNHDASAVMECWKAAQAAGTSPPAVIEDYYTVAGSSNTPNGSSRARKLEREMFPVAHNCGLGVIAFSPMDAGRLVSGYEVEPGSPLAGMHVTLDEVAGELNATRAQVCVSWVLDHPEITSVLAGPESPDHVDEMLAGMELKLPSEIREKLDAASEEYSRRIPALGK